MPQFGYQRTLATEGVLSLKPDLVLATDEAGPPNVLEQLRAAGVRLVLVPSEHTVAGAQAKVRAIAAALDRAEAGEKLAATIGREADNARAQIDGMTTRPTVLFIYARGATMNVAGQSTAADAVINLAGARNAVTGYDGYKPLTAEAAVAAAPEFILTLDRGLASVGGKERLLTQPGLDATPAGQNKRVVALDDCTCWGLARARARPSSIWPARCIPMSLALEPPVTRAPSVPVDPPREAPGLTG